MARGEEERRMGKEREEASKGTRIEDSWARTMGGGHDCGSGVGTG